MILPWGFFSMNQWCSGESSFVGLLHLWWHHWKTPRKGFFSDIQYIFKDFSFRFTEILFLPTVGVLKYWISTAIGPAMWNRPYWRPIFCTQTSTVWSNMWRFKNMVSSRPKNWENTIEGSIGNPRKSKHNLNPNIPLSLNWSPISMDPFPPVPPTQPVWTTVVVVRMTFLVRTLLTAAEWCARFLDSSWNTSGGWIWIWIDMDGDCLVKESLKQKKDEKKHVSVELAMFRLKLSIFVWRGASTTRVSLISFACRGSKINSINETALIRTTLRGNFSWKITMFDGNTWNPKREVWNGWPDWYNYFAK